MERKEAIEVIKKNWPDSSFTMLREALETLIPELKENEDERIRKWLIHYFKEVCDNVSEKEKKGIVAWLEKQSTPQVRTGLEWVNTIDDACDKRYLEEYAHGEYCHEQSFKWGFQEGVDWLEKQGEQKSTDSYCQENCKGFQETGKCFADGMCKAKREAESVEKAEPKFKIGNWIVDKSGFTQQVLDFRGGIYTCTYNSFTTDCESNYHLWNIKDAKHGDVLAYDTVVLIFDHLGTFENRPIIYSWYFADSKKFYGMGTSDPDRWEVEGFYPATKEQRDLLFQKMEEDGYEWDARNKVMTKIEQKPTEWSEKTKGLDELETYILSIVPNRPLDAIKVDSKNIRFLINKEQKPAWSEEDENRVNRLIAYFEDKESFTAEDDIVYANWLKSLRPQSQWKPSDEQMSILEELVKDNNQRYFYTILRSLYEQLKKLREE